MLLHRKPSQKPKNEWLSRFRKRSARGGTVGNPPNQAVGNVRFWLNIIVERQFFVALMKRHAACRMIDIESQRNNIVYSNAAVTHRLRLRIGRIYGTTERKSDETDGLYIHTHIQAINMIFCVNITTRGWWVQRKNVKTCR